MLPVLDCLSAEIRCIDFFVNPYIGYSFLIFSFQLTSDTKTMTSESNKEFNKIQQSVSNNNTQASD